MNSLLETLMERTGTTKVPRYAKDDFGFRGVVQYSGEFQRVEAIPRRQWNHNIDQVVDVLTTSLKTPDGTMRLRDRQAAAIRDALLYRGGLFPIGVGKGKTLISLLVPVVLEAERPLLLVPAHLREKTNRISIPEMRKHWKLHDGLKVMGYEELSLEKNATFLEDYQPDLVILDECSRCKNKQAGRTKRLTRYFLYFKNPLCFAMSGTISKRSLKNFAHIAAWCLQENTPLPLRWQELTEWADAIDADVPDEKRMKPGALGQFCNEGENVRQGFRRRLVETPGVVASEEEELGVALTVSRFDGPKIPANVWAAMTKMRNTWETPNGDIIMNAIDLWRHMRTLALGFWLKWDPIPPKEWADARREWKKYARDTLKHNRRGLDTELQVWNECRRNEKLEGHHPFFAWRELKDTFKINTVPVWISDFAIKECMTWLLERRLEGRGAGIVWVENPAFGFRLEELSCRIFTYYGAGDERILTTREPGIIVSRPAHGEGKDLPFYSKNLVVSPLSAGDAWEQMLGRTHREGQLADEVTCEVFLHCDEFEAAFEKARKDAVYLEDTFGNVQKLNYADVVI